ncbi:polysaccharide deacetylase family protein [Marinicrinis lubricantis]|uniref:Polysaccharide deacetylase family protein n=1 Tax=Marinicrinis lubricantis TaxID=2086470 RepID=A0ABW1IIX8_9BACL
MFKKAAVLLFALLLALFMFPFSIVHAERAQTSQSSTSIYDLLMRGEKAAIASDYQHPEQPTVYLTFDDGPSKLTPNVLDILKQEQVPATFFVLGKLAEQSPDVIQRIADEGHALGNHTYDHEYSDLYADFASFWEQVQRTERILKDITGEATTLMRAPGGTYTNFDAFYFYYLTEAGYHIYDWNVDSGDSRSKHVTATQMIQEVQQSPLKHEVHVLMHDGAGHKETVKALPTIIQWYKQQGYQFKALTPDVEPAQFRIGPVKWDRTMSKVKHSQYVAMVDQYIAANALTESATGGSLNDPVGSDEAVQQDQQEESPLFKSIIWERLLERVQPLRELTARPLQETIYVREWAEKLGGRVHWDQKRRKAYTDFIGGRIEWSLESHSVKMVTASHTWTTMLPHMKVKDGRLTVTGSDLFTMWRASSPYSTSLSSLFSSFLK